MLGLTLAVTKKQTESLIEEHMSGSFPGGGVSLDQVKKEISSAVSDLNSTINDNRTETENKFNEIEIIVSEKADNSTVSSTNDGLMSSEDKTKLDGIENGAETNKITSIVLNGTELFPDDAKTVSIDYESAIEEISINGIDVLPQDKKVNITVPTRLSDLQNDLNITDPPVKSISVNKIGISPDENKNINIDVPVKISELENDLLLEKNRIEKVMVNGTELPPDENRVINIPHPTKLSDLIDDIDASGGGISQVSVNGDTVETDSNGKINLSIPVKTSDLYNDSGYETNKINSVSVNNLKLSPDENKNININIPVRVSQITNDSGFVTADIVNEKINSQISGIYRFKGIKNNFSELPDADVLTGDAYIIKNADTAYGVNAGDNAIAIVNESGTITWNILSGTVDLSNYVLKESGKGLSSHDFTPEYKTKLDTLQTYIHPSYSSCETGLYKFSVDSSGHIGQFYPVLKTDLLPLGIQEELFPLSDNDLAAMFADL